MSTSQPIAQPQPSAQQPPQVPVTTRTVYVTTANPPLIPDENASAYCLTRRNLFDTFIAILLAIAIIYFVLQWRQVSRMGYGVTGIFDSGMGMGNAMRPGMGNDMNRMGNQIAGAINKLLR
jgi:hypothetical protein